MMANRFRHTICEECWRERNGPRTPVRLRKPEPETCCYCWRSTASGIYVREAPEKVLCGGIEGPVHAEEA